MTELPTGPDFDQLSEEQRDLLSQWLAAFQETDHTEMAELLPSLRQANIPESLLSEVLDQYFVQLPDDVKAEFAAEDQDLDTIRAETREIVSRLLQGLSAYPSKPNLLSETQYFRASPEEMVAIRLFTAFTWLHSVIRSPETAHTPAQLRKLLEQYIEIDPDLRQTIIGIPAWQMVQDIKLYLALPEDWDSRRG